MENGLWKREKRNVEEVRVNIESSEIIRFLKATERQINTQLMDVVAAFRQNDFVCMEVMVRQLNDLMQRRAGIHAFMRAVDNRIRLKKEQE